MKKALLILSVIIVVVGCNTGNDGKNTQVSLEKNISNVWVFPENPIYDVLKISTEDRYELVEVKAGDVSNSYNGKYELDVNANVVKLLGFGEVRVKSITLNSLHITLLKEKGEIGEEFVLTLKEADKLLPNKEIHLSKVLDFSNIFNSEVSSDIVYSGDKLYRYTMYYSSDLFLSVNKRAPIMKSISSDANLTEYANFVYSSGQITFTGILHDNNLELGVGKVSYTDYVVSLDDNGRATQVSFKRNLNEPLVKFGYTLDGYLETIALIGTPIDIKMVYDAGNQVEIKMGLNEEKVSIIFADFTIENKNSYKIPVSNMLGTIGIILDELNVLGNASKMLPNTTSLSVYDEVVKLKYIYEIDTCGFVTKFNAIMSYAEEGVGEYNKSLINFEYQYK